MPRLKIDFVKGHMGGNEIIFVHGDQIPEKQYIQASLYLLESPSVRGDQVGVLEKPQKGGDIKVKIVDRTAKNYISMCGGLSQVLPRALEETDLAKQYGIANGFKELAMETDVGIVRISVTRTEGKMTTYTDMTSYVEECYQYGVSPIQVAGTEQVKVGKFLVADAQRVHEKYPDANFEEMNAKSKEILLTMQNDFDKQHLIPKPNADYSLFDMYPHDSTHGRVVFPHCINIGHIEPSCGTGTIAVAIALAATKRTRSGEVELKFDSGGGPFLGGPETTRVQMEVENGRVKHAEFTHSLVEITATGKAWLPTSQGSDG